MFDDGLYYWYLFYYCISPLLRFAAAAERKKLLEPIKDLMDKINDADFLTMTTPNNNLGYFPV